MSRRIAFPLYSTPPKDYSSQWGSAIVRALEQLNTVLTNPGEQRATRLTLTDLPTSDYGLAEGVLFRQGNQVFISLLHSPYTEGLSGTAALGTVTVTT